ncbi:hypothetical protein DL764_008960 [Monosporascus ibericus]|uniref:NmrA-like domain-containing protein n=1 Tax=Monosporascus ibericus TaxID=155417 RepID=A0A4Q4SYD9_9PEZI|nr:hypothetical protein DL764_008960 [Monosporascus ibericus]
MSVLIAGIAGMCGQPLARAALAKGHQVRGIGRNPDKPSEDLSAALEAFVRMAEIYNLAALQKTVKGVGAVICAYHAHLEAVVESLLLLLHAGERTGVKGWAPDLSRASWNYDWKRNRLGDHETRKDLLDHQAHLQFYGHSSEVGAGPLRPVQDDRRRVARYLGDGAKALFWMSAGDLAAYTIEAVPEPGAADGGSTVCRSPGVAAGDSGGIRGGARRAARELKPSLAVGDRRHARAGARVHTA